MSKGKTSVVIIGEVKKHPEHKHLIITPYLDEVERICKGTGALQPIGYKRESIKEMISNGNNICCTHSLFLLLDEEAKALLKRQNYILFIDENPSWIECYTGYGRITDFDQGVIEQLSMRDLSIMKVEDCVNIDEQTQRITWNENSDYKGVYENIKPLLANHELFSVGSKAVVGMIKKAFFECFSEVTICTYRYHNSLLFAYCAIQKITVELFTVQNYKIEKYDSNREYYPDALDRIHVWMNEKHNQIGSEKHNLSKSWYDKTQKSTPKLLKILGTNVRAFSRSQKAKAEEMFWTTFKDYEEAVSPKSYLSSFLACNMKATNEYRECCAGAYLCNIFLNPNIVTFLSLHNVKIDEGQYALSELLQFLWRGAIREGKEFNVFVPSKRMRILLLDWLEAGLKWAAQSPKILKNPSKIATLRLPTLKYIRGDFAISHIYMCKLSDSKSSWQRKESKL